jgi:hypothetical protein
MADKEPRTTVEVAYVGRVKVVGGKLGHKFLLLQDGKLTSTEGSVSAGISTA